MKNIPLALGVVVALFFSTISSELIRPLVKSISFLDFPYARSILATCLDIMVFVVIARCLGAKFSELWNAVGLNKPWKSPLLLTFLAFVPVTLVCLPFASLREGTTWTEFFWLAVGSPIAEEVLFRGLSLGVLISLCRVKVIVALLLPAVIFGLAHIVGNQDLFNAIGIFAFTALGSLIFGYLYLRFHHNLWPAIFFHVGLNALFQIFAFGEDATLNQLGNFVRAAIIAIGLAVAIWRLDWLKNLSGERRLSQ